MTPGGRRTSAPTIGVCTVAGESTAPSEPMTMTASAPSPRSSTGRFSCRSNAGAPWRRSSGRATQSWSASSGIGPSPTEYSECAMPSPLVMRLRAPGRTTTSLPTASRWRTSPTIGQVTVWSPMCGCGSTRMSVSCGPKRSRKHHAPTIGSARWGRVRCTSMPRTPPRGTSRASTTRARGPSHSTGPSDAGGATSNRVMPVRSDRPSRPRRRGSASR
ncbi:hypothetical protein SRABI128_05214 [Microbacterium sp. Bi128]|nr:hypothetical protein SRABI128_05214 [Microbacterium sp. Bi128]